MYANLFNYDWTCSFHYVRVSHRKTSICTFWKHSSMRRLIDSFICRVSIGDGHKGIAMKALRKTCTNYANQSMARNAFWGPFLIKFNYVKGLERMSTMLQWEQEESFTMKASPQIGVKKIAQRTMVTLPSHYKTIINSKIQKITSLVFCLIRWSLFLSWKRSSWK